MSEIEIKFVTQEPVASLFQEKVVPAFKRHGFGVSDPISMRLSNDYYDTPDHKFEENKIGYRIRGCNGNFEQTLKTQKKVQGGLHERQEYNVDLATPTPDLGAFDKSIWSVSWNIEELQKSLERQFSTHFTRVAYDVTCNQSVIEVVIDEGEAKTDKAQSPIHEIELELKQGDVNDLFVLAHVLNDHVDVRLSDVSKAQQGYQLLNGSPNSVRALPEFLPLAENANTEEAFIQALSCGLRHWQYHEHVFMQSDSIKMLDEVVVSIRLLLQSVSLYLPVLQCKETLKLHQLLLSFVQDWMWQDDLKSLRYLLSRKSLFAKSMNKYPNVASYLKGRKEGLLQAHSPASLFFDPVATRIKLMVSQILRQKPWRDQVQGYQLPVMEHAKGWLSQGWQAVQQNMPASRALQPAHYVSTEMLLRQTLWNGFLLADLFAGGRGQFRAPWLDILTGVDELKALLLLKQSIDETDLDGKEELVEWTRNKITKLINVMQRSHQVAMRGDVYW